MPSTTTPNPKAGTLNVFLHGLFTILDRSKGLEILIPDVGSSHAYRAGEFLGETNFPPSKAPLRLEGVQGGTAHFDKTVNLVASGVQRVAKGKVYATLKFPTPREIYSRRPVDLTDSLKDDGNVFSSKTVSLVQVLAYSYEDFDLVLFGGQPVQIAPLIMTDGTQFMNLHIFAEEDMEHDDSHTINGFKAVVSLLKIKAPAPQLTDAPAPEDPIAKTDLPPGTTTIEFLDLAPRMTEVGILGRHLRKIQLGIDDHIQVGLGVGEQPSTCSSVISSLP